MKSRERVLAIFAILCASTFGVIQIFRRLQYPFSGIESFYKAILTYSNIREISSIEQFLNIAPLYGHPPIMSWLHFLWLKTFGTSFLGLYSYTALFYLLMSLGAYKLSKEITKNQYTAVAITFIFLTSEFVIPNLFDFYYASAAMACALWASYFYYREEDKQAAILCFLCPLILESYLIVAIIFGLRKLYKKEYKQALLYLLCPIGLITFYLNQFYQTGSILSNPTFYIYSHRDFEFLSYLMTNKDEQIAMLKQNFVLLYPFAAFCILTPLFKKSFKRNLPIELIGIGFVLFIFYFFINDSPLDRDFIYLHFLMPLIVFNSFKGKNRSNVISIIVICFSLLSFIRILELKDNKFFIPASGHKRANYLREVSKVIAKQKEKRNGENIIFYDNIVQHIFAKSRYGISSHDYKLTKNLTQVNTLVYDRNYFGHMMDDQNIKELINNGFELINDIPYRFKSSSGTIKIYKRK